MREKELDWQVYHLLADGPERDIHALAALLRSSPEEICRSLKRLEKAMLLEICPDGVRVLSIPEMLLRCQARYDEGCPFTIEGGAIRMKSGRERKDD